MLNKMLLAQLDRLSSILDDIFGIVDESGLVLYSGSSFIEQGTSLGLPLSGEELPEFFPYQSFFFLRCDTLDGIFYFFLKGTAEQESEAERLLRMAACLIENRELSQKKQTADFYRKLLLSGPSAVSAMDLNFYSGLDNVPDGGYLVLLVCAKTQETTSSGENEMIQEVLGGMFPRKMKFHIIPLDLQTTAVICALEDSDAETELHETALVLQDTLIAEAMVDVAVSVGSMVKRLADLSVSYKEAQEAAMVGILFDLQQKCFYHDRLGVARLVYGLTVSTCVAFLKETLGNAFLREKSASELLATVKIFLENNQNVSETSRALYIHRNTLMYRLEKFNKLTQMDCSCFGDGMKVELALLIIRYLEKVAPEELDFT